MLVKGGPGSSKQNVPLHHAYTIQRLLNVRESITASVWVRGRGMKAHTHE